jgi:hypothetical protein
MATITKQYSNTNNGGQERIVRDGASYYISSNYNGKGFCAAVEVSRSQAQACMAYTKAPADVVAAILA